MDSAGLMQRKDIMDQSKRKLLALNAAKARLLAVQMVHDAASGHPGGSLSCLDALTTLYFDIMHVDPANPRDPDRDRFVMSKGHCSPALYPVLALKGFFPVEDLKMFRRVDGHMSGHVEMHHVKGVVEKIRGFTGKVIATRDTHSEDYLESEEGKHLPVVHCAKDGL